MGRSPVEQSGPLRPEGCTLQSDAEALAQGCKSRWGHQAVTRDTPLKILGESLAPRQGSDASSMALRRSPKPGVLFLSSLPRWLPSCRRSASALASNSGNDLMAALQEVRGKAQRARTNLIS